MKSAPTLRIKIDNKEDVELFDFTSAMASINEEYHRFLTRSKKKKVRSDCKLYVNRVAEGSIVVDLCEKAPELLPALAPLLVEYSLFLVQSFDYLSGRSTIKPPFLSFKENFLSIKKIFEPVANVNGNNLNLTGLNFGRTVVINNNYGYADANAIQNQCDKEIKKLEKTGESLIKEEVNLRLYQARNSVLSKSTQGNLGIIEDICDKPKVLSFATDRLRYDITKAEKNPLNFIYSVDVEVKLKEGSMSLDDHSDIKGYEILKLHGPIETKDLFSE